MLANQQFGCLILDCYPDEFRKRDAFGLRSLLAKLFHVLSDPKIDLSISRVTGACLSTHGIKYKGYEGLVGSTMMAG